MSYPPKRGEYTRDTPALREAFLHSLYWTSRKSNRGAALTFDFPEHSPQTTADQVTIYAIGRTAMTAHNRPGVLDLSSKDLSIINLLNLFANDPDTPRDELLTPAELVGLPAGDIEVPHRRLQRCFEDTEGFMNTIYAGELLTSDIKPGSNRPLWLVSSKLVLARVSKEATQGFEQTLSTSLDIPPPSEEKKSPKRKERHSANTTATELVKRPKDKRLGAIRENIVPILEEVEISAAHKQQLLDMFTALLSLPLGLHSINTIVEEINSQTHKNRTTKEAFIELLQIAQPLLGVATRRHKDRLERYLLFKVIQNELYIAWVPQDDRPQLHL